MSRRYPFILIVLLFLFSALAGAEPEIQTRLSVAKVKVSEPVTLDIEVKWPRDEGLFAFALPEITSNHLSLAGHAESQESFMQGDRQWQRKTFSYTFNAAEKGKGKIHALRVPYIDPTTQKGGDLEIPFHEIIIVGKFSDGILPFGALFILTAAAATFFGYRYRQSVRKKAAALSKPSAAEDPVEKILRERENLNEAIHELSDLLRPLLARQFQLTRSNANENDLIHSLRSDKNLTKHEKEHLQGVLTRILELKYSAPSLSENELTFLRDELVILIRQRLELVQNR